MADKATTLFAVLALVSCAGGSGEEREPRADAPAGEAVRLARLPDSREGNSAALSGALRAEGPCLYVRTESGLRYLIALTVPGASWDETERSLVLPAPEGGSEDARLRDGDRVTLGGSEVDAHVLEDLWVEPPSEACSRERVWVTHSVAREP